ncbi:2'-5' RNA ligase [Tatumella morbirosei]|uniref:2'-5' RNA ligase n=1 Tax=Tatumella morbirosei TaxID=642227 RepID=A0A095T189_9GAMM|nr:RNA 2',3'-cyclic phosphodiesterase [Tatumella morbirosei]KGD70507.1 2'-5' RNA ligase [Tatumella morbirosei]
MPGQHYFFAIQLPKELQKSLVHWRSENFPADSGRPVPAAAMMMTLAWLGEISDSTCQRLLQQASRIQQPEFLLTLNDAGHWPKSGSVWLGCRPAPSGVLKLGALLRSQAARQGCPQPDGNYHPHVRILHHAFSRIAIPPAGFHWQFPVTRFSLMSSDLSGRRNTLRCEATFPLQPPLQP